MDLLNDNEPLESDSNSWHCSVPSSCSQVSTFGWDPCDGGTCLKMSLDKPDGAKNILFRNVSTAPWRDAGSNTFQLSFMVQGVWQSDWATPSEPVETHFEYSLGGFIMNDTFEQVSLWSEPHSPVLVNHNGALTDSDLSGDFISFEVRLAPSISISPLSDESALHTFFFDQFSLKVGPRADTSSIIISSSTSISSFTSTLSVSSSIASTVPISTSTTPTPTSGAENQTMYIRGIILGAVIGGILLLLALFGVFFWVYKRRHYPLVSGVKSVGYSVSSGGTSVQPMVYNVQLRQGYRPSIPRRPTMSEADYAHTLNSDSPVQRGQADGYSFDDRR